ncbi:MAG TPA: hypothetical protein ENG61_02340, partial [Candidatus Korarchaeota archaeon]|nr:hypothetical protein [Candidatus Korarchaeota archaeon]
MDWLIPFHAKLDEVEPLIGRAKSAIHLGIGDSIVEAVWSMKFFEEIVFTDVNASKLSVLAGFLEKNFPRTISALDVSPVYPEIGLRRALLVLEDFRRSLGLKPLSPGFEARKIGIRLLNLLNDEFQVQCFDRVLFFGFTSVFKKALDEGYPLTSLVSKILRLLKPSGRA